MRDIKNSEAEVRELLQKANGLNEAEDKCYGHNKRGDELTEELAFRKSHIRKTMETKEALEAEKPTLIE